MSEWYAIRGRKFTTATAETETVDWIDGECMYIWYVQYRIYFDALNSNSSEFILPKLCI